MTDERRTKRMLRALDDGDIGAAERQLAGIATPYSPEVARAAAEIHFREQRWSDVDRLYEALTDLTPAEQCQWNFARNLAAVHEHRPQLAARLAEAENTGRFWVHPVGDGRLTIAYHDANQQAVRLSPTADPTEGVARIVADLETELARGNAIALCGLGDGYFAAEVAKLNYDLPHGMEQAIYLLVPDAEHVLTCFMVHDLSQSDGPIADGRFIWCVGGDWYEQLCTQLRDEALLPQPVTGANLGPHGPQIAEQLCRLESEVAGWHAENYRVASEVLSESSDELFAQLLTDSPPRPPRALIVSTRFSTVIRFVARDLQRALRELGWEVEILIEGAAHHRVSRRAMTAAVRRTTPDVVLQVSHLRHENADTFPGRLPFVGWIQDHLPGVTCRRAAESVTDRDFVLTFTPGLFETEYGFPIRQVIPVPLIVTSSRTADTRRQLRPTEDVIYVSHASQQPQEKVAERIQALPRDLHAAVLDCCNALLQTYTPTSGGSAGSFATIGELRRLVQKHLDTRDETIVSRVLHLVIHPLNTLLYRQQALDWGVAATSKLGISLGIYGLGWEHHPRFADYARGTVEHGAELDALTRSARCNLTLEPYPCFAHQRLLDGVRAGGFFLVRAHPANVALQQLSLLLAQSFQASVTTNAGAIAACKPHDLDELKRQLAVVNDLCYEHPADAVRQVRAFEEAQVLPIGRPEALPHLQETSFASARELGDRLRTYVTEPARRETVVGEQWQSIESRLTYKTMLRRVFETIGTRLQP
ncbi:MAG: hypothetical protein AAF581_16685 [Planctomycetota bacterium]